MGPRAKKTDEEKQAEYDQWCNTDECLAIDMFRQELLKKKVDNAWTDITSDYQPYLNLKYAMCQGIKPKVGKAKGKFHFTVTNPFFSLRAAIYANHVL